MDWVGYGLGWDRLGTGRAWARLCMLWAGHELGCSGLGWAGLVWACAGLDREWPGPGLAWRSAGLCLLVL
jgi:hypothetical protein